MTALIFRLDAVGTEFIRPRLAGILVAVGSMSGCSLDGLFLDRNLWLIIEHRLQSFDIPRDFLLVAGFESFDIQVFLKRLDFRIGQTVPLDVVGRAGRCHQYAARQALYRLRHQPVGQPPAIFDDVNFHDGT